MDWRADNVWRIAAGRALRVDSLVEPGYYRPRYSGGAICFSADVPGRRESDLRAMDWRPRRRSPKSLRPSRAPDRVSNFGRRAKPGRDAQVEVPGIAELAGDCSGTRKPPALVALDLCLLWPWLFSLRLICV